MNSTGIAPRYPSRMHRTRGQRLLALGILIASGASAAGAILLVRRLSRPGRYEARVKAAERCLTNRSQDVVLLTGSSYFEMWETSAADLRGLDTLNVGIGGTRIGDQIHYVDRLVFPVNPRALVIYAGSNDINGFPLLSKTADQVVPRVKEYVALVRVRYPGLPVYYVAITEAPIREKVRGEIQSANRQLAAWANETAEVTFIDTAPELLAPNGDIDTSIFRNDRLHLNARGYEKFASVIRRALLADLGPSEG